ncbi:hypothetical protein [Mesorhizobium salmacidum]|uniref:Peptidase M20 dimerisation domain-containing protein n=1 Tax=Mesorhizobium salmacidum TaxID=3015171 RepID=A0ABU8L7B6_9HYPH
MEGVVLFTKNQTQIDQDAFDVIVKGRAGHAASPHRTVDPVTVAAQITLGLQILYRAKPIPWSRW